MIRAHRQRRDGFDVVGVRGSAPALFGCPRGERRALPPSFTVFHRGKTAAA